MNEIIELEEIASQMEQGLDGLDLFLNTWDSVNFQMRVGGETISFNPIAEAAESKEYAEELYNVVDRGRAYLAGWNAVLGILHECLKIQRQKETAAAHAAEQAAQAADASETVKFIE